MREIDSLLSGYLPQKSEVIKLVSATGGFASLSFIKYVADREKIKELTASTLRIGEKQFNYLNGLHRQGKLENARFFIGSIMKSDKRNSKYDYFTRFNQICEKNGWKVAYVRNHSKIILMRTKENYYVLETSSNLNENPQIEQFSFENDKELYDFYENFFNTIGGDNNGGEAKTAN